MVPLLNLILKCFIFFLYFFLLCCCLHLKSDISCHFECPASLEKVIYGNTKQQWGVSSGNVWSLICLIQAFTCAVYLFSFIFLVSIQVFYPCVNILCFLLKLSASLPPDVRLCLLPCLA